MLETDVKDSLRWWQVWDVGDRFKSHHIVTNIKITNCNRKSRDKRLTGHLFMLQNINIWYFLAHFRKGNNVYQFTIHYSLARFWVFFFNKQLNKHLVSVQYLLLLVEDWGWLSNRSLQSTSISSHYPIEHPNPLHHHFYSIRDWNQFRNGWKYIIPVYTYIFH